MDSFLLFHFKAKLQAFDNDKTMLKQEICSLIYHTGQAINNINNQASITHDKRLSKQ